MHKTIINVKFGIQYFYSMAGHCNTPGHCVCGVSLSPDHAMVCHHGGLDGQVTTVCHLSSLLSIPIYNAASYYPRTFTTKVHLFSIF